MRLTLVSAPYAFMAVYEPSERLCRKSGVTLCRSGGRFACHRVFTADAAMFPMTRFALLATSCVCQAVPASLSVNKRKGCVADTDSACVSSEKDQLYAPATLVVAFRAAASAVARLNAS